MLWLFIALRMLVPVQIDLPVSRMNFDFNLDSTVTEVELPRMDTFEPEDNTIQLDQTISVEESVVPAVTFSISWQDVITCVWLAGVFFMVAKQGCAYISIAKWLKRNSTYYTSSDGYDVYLSAVLPEPLSFGGFKSSIYLTETFKDDVWVLNHELTHCRHRDGLMMIIASLLKAIYWFNPLVYLLDKQWEADREIYCDEAVLKDKTNIERKAYLDTLYKAAEIMMEKKLRFSSGLIDGRIGMKERFFKIKRNTKNKTGKVVTILLSFAVVIGSGMIGCSRKIDAIQEDYLLEEMITRVNHDNFQIEALILEGEDLQLQNDGELLECHVKYTHGIVVEHPEYISDSLDYIDRALEKKGIIQAFNGLNAKKSEESAEMKEDAIVKVNLDGLSIWFYEDGTMKLTSLLGSGLQEIKYYKVEMKSIKGLQNAVLENFYHYWVKGKGAKERKENPSLNEIWQIKQVVENNLETLRNKL